MTLQEFITTMSGPTIISGTIAVVGWLMKKALYGILNLAIDYVKSLISKLDDTTTKVGILDARLSELTGTIAEVHKLRADLNNFYSRLKDLENKFENEKH